MTAQPDPLTRHGTIVGTFQYVAPEVLQGKEADGRSDIFALGAVLYEMASGKPAFSGKSQLSVMSAILEKEPEPIPEVAPPLDDVVRTCLAKDPTERWQSAREVARELRWIGELPTKSDGTAPAAEHRSLRLWGLWVVLALVAVAITLMGGYYVTRPARQVHG